MSEEKNEIDKLIETMISQGDDFINNLKSILPPSVSDSVLLFQESNVANLKKIREFLNK